MIQHPLPTTATIKLLYARAIRCAFPECREPLYREDEITGSWVLNSRICHICARSEGGPRWNPKQSSDENRSEDNLLLMCQMHASAIDDPSTNKAYEPPLLHSWKAAQREEHERLREGWPLTTAMAEETRSVSFSNVGLALNNSTVTLIGEGGRSPGAGGGGGPALGPNARGGKGGRGGNVVDLDGNPISKDVPVLSNDFESPSPGAGGGGAPATGDGAVGGNGGDGGEGMLGTIAVEPGDIFEVSVGEGGRAATLPGQHGQSAGDSVVTIKSSDGAVKRILRARGGAGGKSGDLPEDWATISENDLHNGFQVSPPITANSVELRDGLLFMLGGGWSKWVASLPTNVVWPITCIASWRELQPRITHGLHLCLSDANGNEVSRVAFSLTANDPNMRSCIWTLPIGASLDREGLWQLRVHSGQFVLSEASVLVQVHRG